jgi:predicted ATPase
VLPADLKGEALRRAMEEAVAAVITLTTNLQPMVLIIEDWHWSDPASQSALRYLLRLVPSYRLMVSSHIAPLTTSTSAKHATARRSGSNP